MHKGARSSLKEISVSRNTLSVLDVSWYALYQARWSYIEIRGSGLFVTQFGRTLVGQGPVTMPAAMPAPSANLLQVLVEDPSSFDKEMGCMTGILQIFDRHHTLTGRRYGSRRITTANEQELPTAGESPPHDHTGISAYYMFHDHEQERRVLVNNQERREPTTEYSQRAQCASIDKEKFFTKPAPTVTTDRKLQLKDSEESATPRLSFYFKDHHVQNSPKNAALQRDATRHSFSVQTDTPRLSGVQLRASVDGNISDKSVTKSSSPNIRDIVRASFYREKSRSSIDTSNKEVMSGHTILKNLPRSSSVDGRDGCTHTTHMEFPRSSSVDAKVSSHLYNDGNAGTRISQEFEPPRNLTNPRRSYDGKEVPRLTVELEEGPRLGTFKDDRRKPLGWQGVQKPVGLNDTSRYERHHSIATGFDFRESLRAVDFEDPLPTARNGREGHRFSVDGTRDAPRGNIRPRLSVDGRDGGQRELPSMRDEYESRRRGGNVVARLMGLEELPFSPSEKETNSRRPSGEARVIQGLLYGPAGSPHPRERDEHYYVHEKEYQMKKEGVDVPVDGHTRPRSLSPKHHLVDGMPLFRQLEAREALKIRLSQSNNLPQEDLNTVQNSHPSPSPEPLHGDMMQRLKQLRSRNSAHERNTLKQILEAIQLKGLLHPPRHKMAQETALESYAGPPMVDMESRNQPAREQPNASPNLSGPFRRLDQVELEYQATPKFGGQHCSDIESRIKETCAEEKQGRSAEHDAAIVVMKPINTKAREGIGAPTESIQSKELSSRFASSDRSLITSTTRTSTNQRGQTKSMNGRETILGRNQKTRTICNSPSPQRGRDSGTRTAQMNSSPVPSANIKPRPCPTRESHSPKSGLSIKAPFGSTSNRMLEIRSPQGRPSVLKDREESKAALVILRNQTNSLKGRATANDPETPRPKRSTISDAKVKVENMESSKGQRLKAPAEVVILKSKRSGKASNTDAKLFEKETPVIASDHKRQTTKLTEEKLETLSPKTSPPAAISEYSYLIEAPGAGEERLHSLDEAQKENAYFNGEEGQVRVTAGEAVDQSGDFSSPGSFISSDALDSAFHPRHKLEDSEVVNYQLSGQNKCAPLGAKNTTELTEVVTSRGVSVKKSQVYDSGQVGEGTDQPSPVSVLDNAIFEEEECTPSPRAKTLAINLQEAFDALESARRWNELGTRTLEQLAKASSKVVETQYQQHIRSTSDVKFIELNRTHKTKPVQIQLPYDQVPRCKRPGNAVGTALLDRDEEREFVRDLLVASRLTNGNVPCKDFSPIQGYVIDPALLARSERRRRRAEPNSLGNMWWYKSEEEKVKEMLDRRLLFDSVNELLAKKFLPIVSPQPWVEQRQVCAQKPEGQKLVQEIWEELQDIPCATSDDVCDTVQSVLQKDLGHRGQTWTVFRNQMAEVGLELERRIFKELVEEAVRELAQLQVGRKASISVGGTLELRRQLFAY